MRELTVEEVNLVDGAASDDAIYGAAIGVSAMAIGALIAVPTMGSWYRAGSVGSIASYCTGRHTFTSEIGMRPARSFVRVHAALLCLSILLSVVVLMGGGLIRCEELLLAPFIAFVFSELSVGTAHYCGRVLQRRIDAKMNQ